MTMDLDTTIQLSVLGMVILFGLVIAYRVMRRDQEAPRDD